MEDTAKQRLTTYIYYKGLSQRAFERLCGLPNAFITQLKGAPSAKRMSVISEKCPDLNVEWLLTGEGEMLRPVPGDNATGTPPARPDAIPLLDGEASANFAEALTDPVMGGAQFITMPRAPRCDAAIIVHGDSMEPSINNGDYVGFRYLPGLDAITYGDTYIVDYVDTYGEEHITVKRIKRGAAPDTLLLVPDNSFYDPIEIPRASVRRLAVVNFNIHIFHTY